MVTVTDRGSLYQNECSQHVSAFQDSVGGDLNGNIFVKVGNAEFDPIEPEYDGYLNTVSLYSHYEDGQFPAIGESVEITDGQGEGWELIFYRDGDGEAIVYSGLLNVTFMVSPLAMVASFESTEIEWPSGETDTIDGFLEATLEVHCEYCEEEYCDPDISVVDSWPPTSEYCQELESALLGY